MVHVIGLPDTMLVRFYDFKERAAIIILPPLGVRSNAVIVSIRPFVCLSARISIDPHVQITRGFLYTLPVSVARSFSDNNAIRYVLPALCVMSFFHTIERIGQKCTKLTTVHQLFLSTVTHMLSTSVYY